MKQSAATLVWGAALCALLSTTTVRAADFYVDPQSGSMQNDGSAAQPWRTLQEVLEANLVETQDWDSLPYGSGSSLVPKNAGAPVKAGDTIWLRTGYHGEVLIESAYNASPITIAAEAGQEPRIKSLHVRAAGHWIIRGLSISPEHAPSYDMCNSCSSRATATAGPATT